MVSRLSRGLIHGSLALFSLSIIAPYVYLILVSLTNETILSKITWDKFTLDTYKILFSNSRYMDSLIVSLLRTAAGVIANMLFSVLLAYAVSKKLLPGRKGIMIFIIITMVFTGGLIPSYITVTSLGLANHFLAMILPSLVNAFYLILLRNFFMEIPDSLEESAKIDGATDYGILYRIILPVSKPVIATIALFYAVYHWNEWFLVLVYVRDSSLWPLQVLLRNLIIEFSGLDTMLQMDTATMSKLTPQSIKMASIIVATAPIVMVYPFVQKYFVQGIMLGSVKG